MNHLDNWSDVSTKIGDAIQNGVWRYEDNNRIKELILSQLKDFQLDQVFTQEHIVQCGFEIDNVLHVGYKNYDELVEFIVSYNNWWEAQHIRIIFYPKRKISYLEFNVGVAKHTNETGEEKWIIGK